MGHSKTEKDRTHKRIVAIGLQALSRVRPGRNGIADLNEGSRSKPWADSQTFNSRDDLGGRSGRLRVRHLEASKWTRAQPKGTAILRKN